MIIYTQRQAGFYFAFLYRTVKPRCQFLPQGKTALPDFTAGLRASPARLKIGDKHTRDNNSQSREGLLPLYPALSRGRDGKVRSTRLPRPPGRILHDLSHSGARQIFGEPAGLARNFTGARGFLPVSWGFLPVPALLCPAENESPLSVLYTILEYEVYIFQLCQIDNWESSRGVESCVERPWHHGGHLHVGRSRRPYGRFRSFRRPYADAIHPAAASVQILGASAAV